MTYKYMAPLYDHLMENAPYDKWVEFTTAIIRSSDENIQSIIDLGCGTGEITVRLAKKGYQLFGIDYSSEMLSFAEQKAFEEKVSIQWFHQDLRELEGFTNLDLAISYCDVINYITSKEELRNVFERVYHVLKHDGMFIFDIHAFEYVQNTLVDETFAEVTDDVSYIWDCLAGEKEGEMHHQLTFFKLDDQNKYVRYDEYHHQQTYPIHVYEQLLREVGFEKVNIYIDFSLENEISPETAERIFIIAKKRSR